VPTNHHTQTYTWFNSAHAYYVTKILHHDISAGNILLTDDGKGLLIDWELAEMMDEGGSWRPDRTVSYPVQYHSAVHSPRQNSSGNLAIHVRKVALESWQGALAHGQSRVRYDLSTCVRGQMRHGNDSGRLDII